jgi:glutamyl-tRNA synthetase
VIKKDVRVRIAPSPTGFAHVGTAWTALFNFAFAKKHGGKFILRLEDTDVKRNVDEAESAIYEGLHWLGIDWDEGPDKGGDFGPYKQSKRLEFYQKRADELLEKGHAKKDGKALRFVNPNEDISWKDEVRGVVKFPGVEVQDFVLLRSSGMPTYNFAVVVDDIEMKISHVIRGEEHISNTPKQIALYKAFGMELPKFAHLPTLRNKDRKKLSKRRDKVDLGFYQKQGYLPEAMINFFCLLGWSHQDQKEIFDLKEFVSLFSLDRVRKAGPIFDTDKLDWINGEYIRKTQNSKLKKQIYKFYGGRHSEEIIEKTVPLVKDRVDKLSEYKTLAGFFFEKPRVDVGLFGKNYQKHLNAAVSALEKVKKWSGNEVDKVLLKAVKDSDFKTGDFFMDLRIAVTGNRVTPPINESIVILGKNETLERLKKLNF